MKSKKKKSIKSKTWFNNKLQKYKKRIKRLRNNKTILINTKIE